ncbi:PGPGW domain-containing protein [Desertihabitans aurantiacus]|uniref:PGPGW domain-containing protein n=1 Tax=Desertihabitans aurantiacus TaxID=2282477 RepID=UPI000DF79E06|nr:PGPGW domain-containing protein [Desertihabitans aurantiacus]
MFRRSGAALKRIGLEVLGWGLVVLGLAALVLPGPGLVLLLLGLLVLSQQYAWAQRRVAPVKRRALRTADDAVSTWPRLVLSVLGVVVVAGVGVVWGLQPPAPGWWPLPDRFWLFGGWATGGTVLGSAVLALVLLVWSWWRHRRHGPVPRA